MELNRNKKKIVLITTGQPACNPRIVKEADALTNEGNDVTVLYCFFIQWAADKDEKLLKKVTWKYKLVGGSIQLKKGRYFITRARFKLARILSSLLSNKFLFAERALDRAYDELLHEEKKIKADWYIGHNIGALPIAVKAAQFHHAKAGFDFEDYHRGENNNEETLKRIIFLEDKYVPSLYYYSTASKLITVKTELNHKLFNGKVITLLNCFPLSQQPFFKKKEETDHTLNLFWFSQTIGKNRGIEILIEALKSINNTSIHLTLAGRCDESIFSYINNYAVEIRSNIHFAGIIQPEDLPTFASQFDVGLALETGFSINNDIALSNKIFTYLLAGNAIILSQTAMQSAFNEQYNIGASFATNNIVALAEKITFYQNIKFLNIQKAHNFELSKNILNWDNESKKIIEIIN